MTTRLIGNVTHTGRYVLSSRLQSAIVEWGTVVVHVGIDANVFVSDVDPKMPEYFGLVGTYNHAAKVSDIRADIKETLHEICND